MDRGLEFLAGAIGQAGAALNIEPDVCDAYTPQQKGKVERLPRTLIDTLLVGLPHFIGGPRAANGKLEDSGPPLTPARLPARAAGQPAFVEPAQLVPVLAARAARSTAR